MKIAIGGESPAIEAAEAPPPDWWARVQEAVGALVTQTAAKETADLQAQVTTLQLQVAAARSDAKVWRANCAEASKIRTALKKDLEMAVWARDKAQRELAAIREKHRKAMEVFNG